MAAAYFGSLLLNPFALMVLVLVIAGLSSVHYQNGRKPPVIRVRRLVIAYVCALVASALVSAAISYVSPEEALLKWKVPAENYWNAQLNEFLVTFTFALYATLIGIAVIGLPIIVQLGRRRLASVPIVLFVAALISLTLAALMSSGDSPPFRHFLAAANELVFGHVVVAAAFCIGAGLPWRRT